MLGCARPGRIRAVDGYYIAQFFVDLISCPVKLALYLVIPSNFLLKRYRLTG
jgi:hypothetical protein